MFDTRWRIKEYGAGQSPDRTAALADAAGLPFFIAEILMKRGIETPQAAEAYFLPSVDDLHDPYLFEDMENAVQRVIDAAEGGEKVTVFGDYDCDGISATAILWHFLKYRMELDAEYRIPDRFEDGYGLSAKAVTQIAQSGTTLLITVDCGTVSTAETVLARELGMDVIITDHHRCMETLPEAVALINPAKPGCRYPFSHLCGAGVAYKFTEALAEAIGMEGRPLEYLPIAAIATVGDSVSMTGENRIIVSAGMKALSSGSCWLGVRKLMESAELQRPVSVRGIAFGMVPRINAAGRMGSGERALRLLLAEEETEAEALAAELSEENRNRQVLEGRILEEAIRPESLRTGSKDAVVVSVGKNWHHGVIGIVASRLVERFRKPALVFAYEEDGVTIRGSARSVPGFNIHRALCGCSDATDKFGGHEMAAGLSLQDSALPRLIEGLNRYAAQNRVPSCVIPELSADCEVPLPEITLDHAAILENMQPCGEDHPEPVCIARGLRIVKCTAVGSSASHLRIHFSLEDKTAGAYGRPVSGIAFGCGALLPVVSDMKSCDAVFKMHTNEWNGRKSVSLQILDIREPGVYNTACGRKELVLLYNAVRGFYKEGFSVGDLPDLKARLIACDKAYTWFQLFRGIEIFKELGLLAEVSPHRWIPQEAGGKLELENSPVYRACAAAEAEDPSGGRE